MHMLKAIIMCLISCLFGVSCSFFSVTVAKNPMSSSNFNNQIIEENMAIHCTKQRESFNISSDEICELHRWFYDTRSMELTCVCIENGSTKANGKLLQVDGSRAIPSISATNFREDQRFYQGQYAFELNMWKQSDPKETVQKLFNDVAERNGAVVTTECYPIPRHLNSYRCSAVYTNKYHVTWEFPENWSGPARFLKDIAYGPGNNNFEVVGVYWPRKLPDDANKLYVDVTMIVTQISTDVCMQLLEEATDISLQPTTKCHLEFLEKAVLNRPYYIARINLLTPVERHATWTPTVGALWLANRLIWRGYSCTFPVQIRQEIATYEFRVTFVKSILKESQPTELSEGKYCNEIMELASGFIQVCYISELHQHHGIAHILVRRTNASFWEVQCQLMFTLNSHHPYVCRFNVEANSVPKHY